MSSSTAVSNPLTKNIDRPWAARADTRLTTRAHWRIYKTSLLVNDLAMLVLAFWAAYLLRFRTELPIFKIEVVPSPGYYTGIAAFGVLSAAIIFAISGLYNRENLLGGTKEYALVFNSVTVLMLLIVIVGFLNPNFIFARGWLLTAWVAGVLLVNSGRFLPIADPYALAVALDSVIDAFMLLWVESPDRHPFPEDPDVILNIFFKGLIPP